MKFYIAATFQRQKEMRKYVRELWEIGHAVTSEWLNAEEQKPEDVGAGNEAIRDLLDVDRADALILFADVPSSTGGYHVEYGYALGKKPVIVIGGPKNIFQSLPITKQYKTWQDFIMELRLAEGIPTDTPYRIQTSP